MFGDVGLLLAAASAEVGISSCGYKVRTRRNTMRIDALAVLLEQGTDDQ